MGDALRKTLRPDTRLAAATRRAHKDYLWSEQGGRCEYCDCRMARGGRRKPADATVDHVIPLSLGGADDGSNTVLCCRGCNEAKGDTHPREWFRRLGREWHAPAQSRPEPFVPVVLYRPEPCDPLPAATSRPSPLLGAPEPGSLDLAGLKAERARLVEKLGGAGREKVAWRIGAINRRIAELTPTPNPPGSKLARKATRTATFYVGAAWAYDLDGQWFR